MKTNLLSNGNLKNKEEIKCRFSLEKSFETGYIVKVGCLSFSGVFILFFETTQAVKII